MGAEERGQVLEVDVAEGGGLRERDHSVGRAGDGLSGDEGRRLDRLEGRLVDDVDRGLPRVGLHLLVVLGES